MALTNAYADVDAFLDQIRLTDDRADLAKAEVALNAASRQIDRHTGWEHGFWQDSAVVVREFFADDPSCCYVEEGISTTTGLIVKLDEADAGTFTTTLTITTDFILLPVNAAKQYPVQPFTEIRLTGSSTRFPQSSYGRPGVQVTAKFGWPAVPADVKQACLLQAETLFKASGTGAVQFGLDGAAIRIPALNWSAVALLEGYCKPRVG